MNKRGGRSYGTMAERIAATRGRTASADGFDSARALRHCWVIDEAGRRPALLLERRQVGDAWQGRVVLPVLADGRWERAELWLPAEQLEHGQGSPPAAQHRPLERPPAVGSGRARGRGAG
jgi:hypothetical protein